MATGTAANIETHREAVELANEIERADKAVRDMKEQLKTFAETNGNVETSHNVWGFNTTVSWSFDNETLQCMAQDMALDGHNPWAFLSLPKKSLDKLGWGEDILEQYGRKKETHRFTSLKKGH